MSRQSPALVHAGDNAQPGRQRSPPAPREQGLLHRPARGLCGRGAPSGTAGRRRGAEGAAGGGTGMGEVRKGGEVGKNLANLHTSSSFFLSEIKLLNVFLCKSVILSHF